MSKSKLQIAKETLEVMVVKDLRSSAKGYGIKGYSDMTKAVLIETIAPYVVEEERLKAKAEKAATKAEANNEVVEVNEPTTDEVQSAVDSKEKHDSLWDTKMEKRINSAAVGAIIAFKLPTGRIISAAIEARNKTNKRLKLRTKYGREYRIDYTDVAWVRTEHNPKWPAHIYQQWKEEKELTYTKGDDGNEVSVTITTDVPENIVEGFAEGIAEIANTVAEAVSEVFAEAIESAEEDNG